jgi:hypothetical protein
MHYLLLYVVLFSAFAWTVLTMNDRRPALALILAGTLVITLVVIPPQAEAQGPGGIVQAIQAVLKVLNTLILPVVNSIHGTRSANSAFFETAVWPVQSINQSNSLVLQMIARYHNLMSGILNINLRSATLPAPQSMEMLIRDHQVNNFGGLTQSFNNTYRAIPAPTDANQSDRDMSDFDDALTLDSLKTLKASDSATDLELQAADSIESAAGQAFPGSTPFLTATATSSSIRSQALTQKMLAAELRQEAARIAHQNGLRKRGAMFTTQLRGTIMNLSQHN